MSNSRDPLVLDTSGFSAPLPEEGLWENRAAAYRMYDSSDVPKCTVAVLAYNRLHKTKYCVECILNYTKDVDYELLLIDNGSGDGTLEYFQSVEHGNKKVLHITNNIGSGYAWKAARNNFSGKYLVIVSNDIYVTKNWLSNLLKCYESDPKIGFVEPVSSNVSNYQQVNLEYADRDEMQQKAAEYNQSNPLLWDERMRLISLIGIYSRPVLDIVGINDAAFLHDFTEDDLAARLRRAGYKLMLCRDTWVCHDHDYSNLEDKDAVSFRASLDYGRAAFKEKYHGLDAWDDILNMEFGLLTKLETYAFPDGELRALVVDGRCGSPALEVRNHLKRRKLNDVKIYAFTTQAKYFAELQTVADDVKCDRIDFIEAHYDNGIFDVVALCEPVNVYPEPAELIPKIAQKLKPGGIVLYKLRNTSDGKEFLYNAIREE